MTDASSKVVDINTFKAARAAQQQLDLLAPSNVEGLTADTGTRSETPQSDRALSDRDVAHRARMLAHLGQVPR